jgi:DNA-binding response OmpR family regulator
VTATDQPRQYAPSLADGRSDFELAVDQVRGIDAWVQAHRVPVVISAGLSREDRLDRSRRRDVVARQRQALRDWTEQQLHAPCTPAYSFAAARAVIAHRHTWFAGKVTDALQVGGVRVVAGLDNGADALGVVIAEQPDLLLLEDKLPMVSGPELCQAVTRWAPRTIIAVQVEEDRHAASCLDAGATVVFTRRTPPADVAVQLLHALIRSSRRGVGTDAPVEAAGELAKQARLRVLLRSSRVLLDGQRRALANSEQALSASQEHLSRIDRRLAALRLRLAAA